MTRLTYCTSGIILRKLQQDPLLSSVNIVVVDEIHERSLDVDFLMIRLKDLLTRREDLRVVLMSATVNTEKFSEYWGNCPVLHIPGRTFPVSSLFLEDVVQLTGYALEEDSEYAVRVDKERETAQLEISGRGKLEFIHLYPKEERREG